GLPGIRRLLGHCSNRTALPPVLGGIHQSRELCGDAGRGRARPAGCRLGLAAQPGDARRSGWRAGGGVDWRLQGLAGLDAINVGALGVTRVTRVARVTPVAWVWRMLKDKYRVAH